jgi:RecA/RadA recombinase
MLQPQDVARLIEEFLGLLPATVGDTDAKAMSSLLVIGAAKGNRIIQIFGAEFSLGVCSRCV